MALAWLGCVGFLLGGAWFCWFVGGNLPLARLILRLVPICLPVPVPGDALLRRIARSTQNVQVHAERFSIAIETLILYSLHYSVSDSV